MRWLSRPGNGVAAAAVGLHSSEWEYAFQNLKSWKLTQQASSETLLKKKGSETGEIV